jgi:hypothetical protein
MDSSTTRRRLAEGTLMLVVAFLITLAAVPSTVQPCLPCLLSSPLSYSQSQPLYAAGPFQQEVPIEGGYQVPYTTPLSALDLYLSYARAQQVHYVPTVAVQSASLTSGQNITFVMRPPTNLSQTSAPNIYLFVLDPEGAVAATSPFGASMSGSSQTNQLYFSANGVTYASNNPQGGIEFTWRTPADGRSVGVWRVFAVVVGSQGGGQAVGVAEANVQVDAPQGLGTPATLLAWAGAFVGIYQFQRWAVTSYRKSVQPRRRWLVENGLWFVAAALLIAFILLAYLG